MKTSFRRYIAEYACLRRNACLCFHLLMLKAQAGSQAGQHHHSLMTAIRGFSDERTLISTASWRLRNTVGSRNAGRMSGLHMAFVDHHHHHHQAPPCGNLWQRGLSCFTLLLAHCMTTLFRTARSTCTTKPCILRLSRTMVNKSEAGYHREVLMADDQAICMMTKLTVHHITRHLDLRARLQMTMLGKPP